MRENESYLLQGTIGDWKIVRFLGMGQSGEVYEVLRDGHRGALKICRGRQVTVSREEFAREIATMKAQPAPGLMPRFLADGKWEGLPFFVMEFADDVAMPDTAQGFIEIATGLIESVGCLHRNRHTHNDIKPSNVGRIGKRIVLRDFGSALPFRTGKADGIRVGTDGFMAPEVDKDGQTSSVADIHALGETLKALCPPACRRMFDPVIYSATEARPGERTATPEKLREELLGCVPDYRREVAVASRLDKFKAVAKRAAVAVAMAALGIVVVALCSRLYRRTRMTSEELALAHAEASGIAAERYYYGKGAKRNLELSRKHAEAAARFGDTRGKSILKMLEEAEK